MGSISVKISRQDVVDCIKNTFARDLQLYIENGILSREDANLFFKTLFEEKDLVQMVYNSLWHVDSCLHFLGVDYIFRDEQLTDMVDPNTGTWTIHAFYDRFAIHIITEQDVLDGITYFKFVFKSHELVI